MPMQRARPNRQEMARRAGGSLQSFQNKVRGTVNHEGFDIIDPREQLYAFWVPVGERKYVGVVCSPMFEGGVANRIRTYAEPDLQHMLPVRIVVVRASLPTDELRTRMGLEYGVDVIGLPQLGDYLREWRAVFKGGDAGEESKSTPPQLSSRAARLRSNATAMVPIARSLSLQIDDKLETLRRQNPNSKEAIAARDTAISEYEELRARVDELEAAIAKLQEKNAKVTPAVSAGKKFGLALEKWISKSASKHLDGATNVGIICGGAGLLMLMGLGAPYAVGVATMVVTGKSVAGLFKRSH